MAIMCNPSEVETQGGLYMNMVLAKIAPALARLEAQVALEVLVQRLPHPRLIPGQTLEVAHVFNFRGYERLES